jgi:hypothetical protein|tara:strand:- start:245 stop:397 length:153 start_codon:yes stop_codon:yes gene_type:complete
LKRDATSTTTSNAPTLAVAVLTALTLAVERRSTRALAFASTLAVPSQHTV